MSPDTKTAKTVPLDGGGEIVLRQGVNGKLVVYAEREAFIPGKNVIVSPPKGTVKAFIFKQKGHSAKLDLFLTVEKVDRTRHLHVPESLARRRDRQKLIDFGREKQTEAEGGLVIFLKKAFFKLIQGTDLILFHDLVKIKITKLGKDQIVDFIERDCFHRKVASPEKIRHHICHTAHFLSFLLYSFSRKLQPLFSNSDVRPIFSSFFAKNFTKFPNGHDLFIFFMYNNMLEIKSYQYIRRQYGNS